MHARKHALILLLVALLTAPAAVQAQQDDRPQLTLRDIHASGTFQPNGFQGGRWAEEGPVVTYIEPSGDATDLVSYNLETDARTTLIEGRTLQAPDAGRLIQIEDYQYSRDGETVLLYTDSERVWRLNTKGFYYVYDLESETLTPVSDRAKGYQMFAKLSPDGDRVAFVRDRNLFVVDLQTGEETQLTTDGAEGGIINGTTDWVYEEEFGLRDAWAWSPDGRYIAFLKLDETATRDFAMADLRGQYPELTEFRYPKAGEANSEVQVGVIDTDTQAVSYFDTDTWNEGGDEHEYIPRLGWTPELDGTYYVWMFRLDRDQNDLDLLYGNPATTEVRTVLQEHEETWIDVESNKIAYLDDGEHFLWRSEASGYDHVYLYENEGDLVRQLTLGEWDVTDIHGVDEENGVFYFTAAKEGALERHLYRAPFSTESGPAAEPVRITERSGTHSINMSGDLRYYIDAFSSIDTPLVVTLHRADGEALKVLQDNEVLAETLAAYDLPKPEFITVAGADGTPLNAWVIKPTDFDPTRRYPLLMHVYGGPGSQTVRNAWGGSNYLWYAYLADELGVVVASVDNRGTGARGKAFKSGTYRQLGQLEAADQIAAAQWFASQRYIDPDRIGIWGWSYGGYMTLMSLLYGEGPQTFDTGIAVAPVTDWRQYDTIYTERYMSTPQKNPEGYEQGAPTTYADRMSDDQSLLIVHGDLDDNVHFQNAVQMVDALQEANKQFDLMVYPGRNHGIYGGNARLHLYTLMTNYIREHLVEEDRVAIEQPTR